MKHTYTVTGMHCGSCVAKIEDALRSVEGVDNAKVTLNPPAAEIEMGSHVPLPRFTEVMGNTGDYRLEEPVEAMMEGVAADVGQPTESLYPLFLIVGYILSVVVLVAAAGGDWSLGPMMRNFMAGFFLVFSFFKLLNLREFVDAYRGYDPLARRSKAYAWAYPFIELGLGVAYLVNLFPATTSLITLILMGVGAVGVLRALRDKRSIRCACLGTALNLPMTKVTLIEDITMAAMAAAMLVLSWTS